MGRWRSRPNGKFLTAKQAAQEYGLDYQRIIAWINEGRLRRIDPEIVGRSYHISRAELDQFIADHMVQS